ncbi:chorismate-binding protein [Maribacter sp.]|nr:chorismate-binding protein [Maribacter sp.]
MFSALQERINSQFLNELPFVAYRKPNKKEVIGIFQSTDVVHLIPDFNATGFVFSPFDSAGDTILIPVDEKMVVPDFTTTLASSTPTFEVDSRQQDFHIKLVEKGISEIKKGHFKKIVLSRRVKVAVNDSPLALFQKLLTAYSSAFCYLWHHPKVGTWLGATPEILLRTENKRFTTMSLAGTQVYQAEKPIEWGQKELDEQALVTDFIKNALRDKVADIHTSDLESVRAGSLLHLRTKVTGRMIADLKEIIRVLHPTPAVCGMPMTPSKRFILEHENYNRQFYTGFLGELNFKRERQRSPNRKNQENQAYRSVKTCSELFVNLRCMQLVKNRAHIYVGGGITNDSDPKKEWQETVNKSSTMLKVLY